MFTFAIDYYLFVLVASIGVLQIAVSLGRLKGLLIFKSPFAARGFGLALTVGAFIWFFASGPRILNDYEGGLDANFQALFFFLGAASALVVTIVSSSLVNLRMESSRPLANDGLEVLRHTNYARGLAHSFRRWSKEWRKQTS